MNKHLLAAMLTIAAALATGQARADWKLNGTQINGLTALGPWLNGTQINGLPTPGPVLQGTQVNGMPTPGPVLQGTQVSGVSAGPIVQAIQASAAPNWSALPASQLTVRLVPAI